MYQVLNVSRVTFRLILVTFQIKPNLKVSHPVSMTKKRERITIYYLGFLAYNRYNIVYMYY